MTARFVPLLAGGSLLAVCAGAAAVGVPARPAACPDARLDAGYLRQVDRALRARTDAWGNALLASPSGTTYAGVRRYLKPLLFARGAKGRRLTASGVYYLPFSQPAGAAGAESVALHVADGSQIVSQRVGGRSLSVTVDGEPYGSCLARLAPPRLLDGYLPVLETTYSDGRGARFDQESFAARIPQTSALASFVRLRVLGRPARVRLTPSARGYLRSGAGGHHDGRSVTYTGARTIYVAWLNSRAPSEPLTVDRETYEAARASVREYWRRRLAEGASIVVPERRVVDAERSLLVQNLGLTWRYSIGNPYEEFSFPEGVDVAEAMSAWGFADVARAMLRTSLTRAPTPYPNWKIGQKLVGSALYYRLFRDSAYVDQVTPVLSGYVEALGRQISATRRGILGRERYSSDIADSVYGLHSQAIAWQGLRSMARVWEQTGHGELAARAGRLATRLETGLRAAVRASQVRLADGSLFLPVRLLDREQPYETLTASRAGSYWNLVAPYALASGFFAPRSREAEGALAYMLRHGSRLVGLVRAGAFALYGPQPSYPTSGTDQVYGLNVARFLADNDRPDQLVLSLYGQLAAAMTEGTFVSGEGATVAPLDGETHRSMYLPPNGASNAAFLETLRLTLVHETFDRAGAPRGLELGYATPRGWLAPGKRIAIRGVPTSFGAISFSVRSSERDVRVSVDVPDRQPLRTLSLRLRLPRGTRIASVVLDGRPYARFDRRAETIELPTAPGPLELVARTAGR